MFYFWLIIKNNQKKKVQINQGLFVKKIKIAQIIGILLFSLYISLLLLDLLWGVLGEINNLIFSCVMAGISLSLIYKGVLLKSSSTLWFAITLILSAIVLIIFNLFGLDLNGYYFIFVLIPIIASIFNLIIFHYKIYIKVIILNISIAIPIFTAHFWFENWWQNLIVGVVAIIIGILICRSINFEREKV